MSSQKELRRPDIDATHSLRWRLLAFILLSRSLSKWPKCFVCFSSVSPTAGAAKGASICDVRTRGGEEGHGKADVAREVG